MDHAHLRVAEICGRDDWAKSKVRKSINIIKTIISKVSERGSSAHPLSLGRTAITTNLQASWLHHCHCRAITANVTGIVSMSGLSPASLSEDDITARKAPGQFVSDTQRGCKVGMF